MKNLKLNLVAGQLRIAMAVICLFFMVQAKADTWTDPTWKMMLDSSDLVALIQYTSKGDIRATARILNVYKGKLKAGDEIWIGGFSNRYGPNDIMNKGDKYLVFLNGSKITSKGLAYWQKELEKDPTLTAFVEAYKNTGVYHVWTPTSGDLKVQGEKVQYDLIQTSYYRNQLYYPLEEFEDFLHVYYEGINKTIYCQRLVSGITPASDAESNTQHLLALVLLGYNLYDDVFENYITCKNPSSRYALAQLMGNMQTEKTRSILIALLKDEHSIVQGEAVRQLKKESPEIVAPVLLAHLKTSGDANAGPPNIMDPVRNTVDGGKTEIIKTLGEWKYKPAIPFLLSILDTENEQLFQLTIDALKKIGSNDYVTYLNKHLDKKTDALIYKISQIISSDSIAACLPSFKNFISTCNRNIRPGYSYTISTCCGIGYFEDSSTCSFLLADYARFFTYKDSLQSDNINEWTREYIRTFTDLKIKEARPLIYKSIFDWHGINEDFGIYPKLFKIKKMLEDSIAVICSNTIARKGYKLDYCMAFIENTKDVITGVRPKAKYVIQVTVPSESKKELDREMIAHELHLPRENVYIRFRSGVYYDGIQPRFDKKTTSVPIYYFLKYAESVPDKSDLPFFQGILDNNFLPKDYYERDILETMEKVKMALKK